MRKLLVFIILSILYFPAFSQFKYKLRTPSQIDIYATATNYETIGTIPAYDSISLISYNGNLWGVKYNEFSGYILDAYVSEEVPGITDLKQKYLVDHEKNQAEKVKARNAELAKLTKELKAEYTKLYGAAIANKIMNSEIWVGMTKQMARHSIGDPIRINKTTNKTGVTEQWVYESQYLYFRNGKLDSFQESY